MDKGKKSPSVKRAFDDAVMGYNSTCGDITDQIALICCQNASHLNKLGLDRHVDQMRHN